MIETETFINSETPVADIPTADSLSFEPVEKSYRTMLTVSWFGILAFVTSVNAAITVFAGNLETITERGFLPWIILAFVAALLLGFVIPHMIWRAKGFRMRNHDVHYEDGIIWHKVTSLPFMRIQHVELESGPIERLFKLTTVKFYSAGGGSADMKIPGLKFATASKIRATVLAHVDENADPEESMLTEQSAETA